MDRRRDAGAAVPEFVMVSGLVVMLFLVVFQVGLALHARNVIVSVAAEGARYGANADVDDPGLVRARVRDGIASAFTSAYAAEATITPRQVGDVYEVQVSAPYPLAFVAGPLRFTVAGHALEERR
ncbi:MAG: TadE family protein [Frankiales bacterium]|nr:TadE family protein [Frankiales bacterium]